MTRAEAPPPGDEPTSMLAVIKVAGSSVVRVAVGTAIYFPGRRK
jgi:hypothetical protein